MGYLKCDDCGGYYELQDGESLEDFEKCECGGKLRYVETVEEEDNKLKNEDLIRKESSLSYYGAMLVGIIFGFIFLVFAFYNLMVSIPSLIFFILALFLITGFMAAYALPKGYTRSSSTKSYKKLAYDVAFKASGILGFLITIYTSFLGIGGPFFLDWNHIQNFIILFLILVVLGAFIGKLGGFIGFTIKNRGSKKTHN